MLPPEAEGRLNRARILLVDDDERNLLALSQVLKDTAEIVTAGSGRQALRHLLDGEFAVILLDVFMPDMDGYEVAELVRMRPQTAGIPIIFLSAIHKEAEHLLRGYSMGAVDYVFKPVDPLVLTSKVSVFVDLFNARRQIEAKSRAEQELREAGYRAELERLRIESELHATAARQAAILEALPLALFEAAPDPTGRLVRRFIAGDLSKLVGAEAGDLETGALSWEDRIHPDDLAIRPPLYDRSTASVVSSEYRWICADKSQRHFFERIVLLADGEAAGAYWVGTLVDVTDRKNLELQLVQSGKMDALGQLTGGVAHDFNNVLAAILAGTNLLGRRAALDESGRRVLDQVRQAAEKGTDLVRRMMAFARKQDLKPAVIPVASFCESIAGLVDHALGGAITLRWSCLDKHAAIYADRSLLELSIVNLILNARDAMPAGGEVEVAIAMASDRERSRLNLGPDDYLRIEVRDQGVGISTEMLERVTEPFFTTKEVGKGTGLGLSMVAGFVQQSEGRLEIESQPGKGTSIRLFMRASSFADQPTVGSRPMDNPGVPSIRRVLLVDDDPLVRVLMAEQLREMGVSVVEVGSGEDAVDYLQAGNGNIDLLLSDFAMPGLNGMQTIERARTICPQVACAIMTGHIQESFADAALRGVPILRKPVPGKDLARLLGIGLKLESVAN